MSKLRVYEVARDLSMDNKTLVALFQSVGITEVRNHMSAVAPEQIDRVKRHLEKQGNKAAVEERIRPTVVKRRARGPVSGPPSVPERPSAPPSEARSAAPVSATPRSQPTASEQPVAAPPAVSARSQRAREEDAPREVVPSAPAQATSPASLSTSAPAEEASTPSAHPSVTAAPAAIEPEREPAKSLAPEVSAIPAIEELPAELPAVQGVVNETMPSPVSPEIAAAPPPPPPPPVSPPAAAEQRAPAAAAAPPARPARP